MNAALVLLAAISIGAKAHQTPTPKTDLPAIPVVSQAPTCPPEGWCGEASIQMIGMYYGCYFPQKLINAAGHPSHPDLWNTELGPAMQALGFTDEGLPTGSCDEFITALKPQLQQGIPVILGVNVYDHGQGGAHFCIAAKCDDKNLTVNTTWSFDPVTYSWLHLHQKDGITLADVFMGLAVPPPPVLATHRLRLYPVDGKSFFGKQCKLRMAASHLIKGAKYQVRSYPSVKEADENRGTGEIVAEFTADGPEFSQEVTVDGEKPIVFVLTHSHG